MTSRRLRTAAICFTLFTIAFPLADAWANEADGGDGVIAYSEHESYPFRHTDGSAPVVRMLLYNNGSSPITVRSDPPFQVFDDQGSAIYTPVQSQVIITISPGQGLPESWSVSSNQRLSDALTHHDAPWLVLTQAGIVPPGSYHVVWTYDSDSGANRTISLPIHISREVS